MQRGRRHPRSGGCRFEPCSASRLVGASSSQPATTAPRGNPVDCPAGCSGAFAIGATDPRDRKAGLPEYGPQVDIMDPAHRR
jgi:hypothetical protein